MALPAASHFLDHPASWTGLPANLIVRGWAFHPDGRNFEAIRLRWERRAQTGVTGLPRPDVSAALRHAPGPNTGFEIRARLSPGKHELLCEGRTSDGQWHTLFRQTAQVRRNYLPVWLGGGSPEELVAFQLPGHGTHAPRPLRAEHFPTPTLPPKNLPSLAIVTPSYQQGKFLAETIRSVLEQPGVQIRYVVQDGGSTDESVAIIRAQAERLSAWESAPDQGQSDAIRKGFSKTSGGPDDLMAWLNSDDFYLPGALAHVADFFARHPEVNVMYGHRILVDENSQEIGRWFLPQHDPEILRLNDFVPQETLFWRRRLWDQVGGLDASFRFAMDWDLLLRFQEAGAKIIRLPRFLACFRVHSAQKTSAAMHSIGQQEIDRLRERTFGRRLAPEELLGNPRLIHYLRGSARIEALSKIGVRAR